MNRLIEAQYYNTTDPSRNGRYNEKIWDVANNKSGYDLNGNIKFLSRTGKSGLNALGITTYGQMDKLAYTYTGNQLQAVTETGVKTEGFIEGTNTGTDYQYDANGNMNLDQNKTIQTITYNHLNLPDRVTKTSGDYIQYQYDATGRKLNQLVYNPNNVLQKKTDYAGEFFYEDNVLKFINHEEGRIVMTGAAPEYQYNLKDHLGNVRVTFTSKAEQQEDVATLETTRQADEEGKFLRYDNLRLVNSYLFDHTNNNTGLPSGNAMRLSGGLNEKEGIAKSVSVMAGDTIAMEVWAKYVDPNANPNNFGQALKTLLANLASPATAPQGTIIDGLGYASSTTSFPAGYLGLLDKSSSTGGPKAYLNYLIYDHDFNFKDGGFVRMSADGKEDGTNVAHQLLSASINITEAGYVYIYLSNEEDTPVEVYFDDFKVRQMKSPVIQQDSYYPFGLRFNSYTRENTVPQDYQYNGKELQEELNVGLYDFLRRQYDPSIGRFTSIDPAADLMRRQSPYNFAFNNPMRFSDPDGMAPDDEVTGVTVDRKRFDKKGRELKAISFRKAVRVETTVTIHGAKVLDKTGDMGGTKRDATDAEVKESGEAMVKEIQDTWSTNEPKIDRKGRQVSVNVKFEGDVQVIHDEKEATKKDFLITLSPEDGRHGTAQRGSNQMTVQYFSTPLGEIMNRNELGGRGPIDPGRNGTSSHEFGHIANLPDRRRGRSIMNQNYDYGSGGPSFQDRWDFFRGR